MLLHALTTWCSAPLAGVTRLGDGIPGEEHHRLGAARRFTPSVRRPAFRRRTRPSRSRKQREDTSRRTARIAERTTRKSPSSSTRIELSSARARELFSRTLRGSGSLLVSLTPSPSFSRLLLVLLLLFLLLKKERHCLTIALLSRKKVLYYRASQRMRTNSAKKILSIISCSQGLFKRSFPF